MNYRLLSLISCLLITGCASATKNAKGTALTGIDLISMTDDMANKLGSSSTVLDVLSHEPTMTIVVQPVINNLRAEIIPQGQAYAFTGRVRALLNTHAPDRFVWVMNKQAYYDLRKRELDFDVGPNPERIQPRYALTATFTSLTDENRKKRESYYLCVYELTNLADGKLLWTDKYEIKKQAVKGFLD